METVVLIIMLLLLVVFVLKLTFMPVKVSAAVCLALALFTGLMGTPASGQSKTLLADWLANPAVMTDLAVLLTVDVLVLISFCILKANRLYGSPISRGSRIALTFCSLFPGLMMFLMMFIVVAEVIFSFPGRDFATLSWLASAVLVALVMPAVYVMRVLVSSPSVRLEMLFYLALLVAGLGIAVSLNGRTAVAGCDRPDWLRTAVTLLMFLAGGTAGFVVSCLHARRKIRNLLI